MNKYKPNFNDKRTFTRATKALGFVLAHFSTTEPKHVSTRMIDKFLGQQQNNLSKYLRYRLLQEHNSQYSKDFGIFKSYICHQEGIEALSASINCSVHSRVHRSRSINKQTPALPHSVLHLGYQHVIDQVGDQLDQKVFNYQFKDGNKRWDHPLHHIKRDLRTQILQEKGFVYNYDIDSCLPSIILSLNYIFGTGEVLPRIHDDVINNKEHTRQRLALELDIDTKTAKQLITATFNGAHVSMYQQSSIYKMMYSDDKTLTTARIMWLKQDTWYQELKQEIKECWQHIIPHYEYMRAYKKNGYKKPFYAKQKSQIYFINEFKVANVIKEFLQQNNINYFWIHDGFTTDTPINTSELEQIIFNKSRFLIKLTGEQTK